MEVIVMTKIAGIMFLMAGLAGLALADSVIGVPEIPAGSAGSALALLTGAALVIRGRRKK
jgi:hypothetical protein